MKYMLLIFLILILIIYIKKNIRENFDNKKKIAIYSYNFGNYRNELNSNIDNFKSYPEFDYYFYSDKNIKSKKWNVITVPLKERKKHMNKHRLTTKFYKWKSIPKELLRYEYIIHIDSTRIRYLNNFSFYKISKIIDSYPNVSLFLRRHPYLKNVYGECNKVISNNVDNESNVNIWRKKLFSENYIQKMPHIEACFFIRNIKDKKLNIIFSKIFDEIIKNKLCRDQLVVPYIFDLYKYEKIKIVDEFSIK